jgi:diguanylate cyclase (GGDEF)-like protein
LSIAGPDTGATSASRLASDPRGLPDNPLRDMIEQALQRSSVRPFPPELEAQFRARRGPVRRGRLARTLTFAAPLMVIALALDWLISPALLPYAVPLRLLAAALCGICALILPRVRGLWLECAVYAVPILAIMLVTEALGELGPAHVADRYMMAAIIVVAALIVTQPLPFRSALCLGGAATALFPLVLWLMPGKLPLASNLDVPAFNAGVMTVAALMAYRAEFARRLGFLTTMRNEVTTSDLNRLNTELLRLSSTDTLTGLANRRQFEAELQRHWSDRKRAPLAVALVDVDHFKSFNDSAGHAAGDVCLCRVAEAIAGAMRQGLDQAARFGGEEFTVLLPGVTEDELSALGERLRRAVLDLALPNPGQMHLPVTISVGLSWRTAGSRAGSPDTLLREADRALYVAKNTGRNRVVLAELPRLAATG